MAVWLLNTDLVSICIQMTFKYVDYKMNYLTKLQTVELEKAPLVYCHVQYISCRQEAE